MTGEVLVLLKRAAHFKADEPIEGQPFGVLISEIAQSAIAYFLPPKPQPVKQFFPIELDNGNEHESSAVIALRMLIAQIITLNDEKQLTLQEFNQLMEHSNPKLVDLPKSWQKKWSGVVENLKSALSHKLEVFLQDFSDLPITEDSWNNIDAETRAMLEPLRGQNSPAASAAPKAPVTSGPLRARFAGAMPKAFLGKSSATTKLPGQIVELRLATMQIGSSFKLSSELFRQLTTIYERLKGPENERLLLKALIDIQQKNDEELTAQRLDDLCRQYTPKAPSRIVIKIIFDINQAVIIWERNLNRTASLERQQKKQAKGENAAESSSAPQVRPRKQQGDRSAVRGSRVASMYVQKSTYDAYSHHVAPESAVVKDKAPLDINRGTTERDDWRDEDDEKIINPFEGAMAAAHQRKIAAEQRIVDARGKLRVAMIQQSTAQRQIRAIDDAILQKTSANNAATAVTTPEVVVEAAAPPPPPPPLPPVISLTTTALVITRRPVVVVSAALSSEKEGLPQGIKATPNDIQMALANAMKAGLARKLSTSRKVAVQERTNFPQTDEEKREEEKRLRQIEQSAFEAKEKQLQKLTDEMAKCTQDINQIAFEISEVAARIAALQTIPRQELFNIVFESRLKIALQEAERTEEEADRAEREVAVEEQFLREMEGDVTRKLAQAEAMEIDTITLNDDDSGLGALLQKPLEKKGPSAAAASSSTDTAEDKKADVKVNLLEDLKAAFRSKRMGPSLNDEDEDDEEEIVTKLDEELGKQNTLEQQWRRLKGRIVQLEFEIKTCKQEKDRLQAKLAQPTNFVTSSTAVVMQQAKKR